MIPSQAVPLETGPFLKEVEKEPTKPVDLSIIVPVLNEGASLPELAQELRQEMSQLGRTWEIIFINDGSTDQSAEILNELADQDERIRVIHFRRNFGQTAAMMAGFDFARGDILIPIDGDGQNDPADIAKMLELLEQGYDVVSGWRKDRQDNFIQRNVPSILANQLISAVSGVLVRGVPLRDPHGKIAQWYGTLTDIEARKRAEQEREKLRQLEAGLAHINRVSMMGEMAASLAHEIKQPIAAAITSANSCIEWLAHEPPNLDRARESAIRIDKYGNRAAEIIDRIRSFYRKSPPERELVDVNGIVDEMFTLLKGEATRCSVAMRTELSAELAQNHGGPCAAAAGVHEPHAQRHRSHEGLRAENSR